MLRSMTGFGSAAGSDGRWAVKVEVRTVNHRYADIQVRLPKGYLALEERLRRLAGTFLARGRVEIFVSIEEYGGGERTVRLNRPLLLGYVQALREAETLVGAPLAPSADMLARLPDVLVAAEPEYDPEAVWPLVERVADEALRQVEEMRSAEGMRLAEDVRARIGTVAQLVEEMAARAPQAVERYRERLEAQLAALLGRPPVDEQRIAQEIALHADKSDIAEEITRARSHIEQFLHTCASGGSIGRKLDFLIQELFREVNTVASKCQDAEVAHLVVEAKSELEKVREQVQNVE